MAANGLHSYTMNWFEHQTKGNISTVHPLQWLIPPRDAMPCTGYGGMCSLIIVNVHLYYSTGWALVGFCWIIIMIFNIEMIM